MQRRAFFRYAGGVAALGTAGIVGVSAIRRHGTRQVAVTSGGETASPSPSGSPPHAPSAKPTAPRVSIDTKAIENSLLSVIKRRGGHASVAITDRISRRTLSVRGSVAYQCASIIKVPIVAGLMMRRQNAGATLSAAERELARAAITRSDNDAASQLFDRLGGTEGLISAVGKLGMTGTRPSDFWGMTTSTADDQIAMLKAISVRDGLLTRTHQNLLFGWMADVVDGQDFGVPAAGGAATAVYVKDGWFDRDDQGGLWQVNTIGRLVEPGADWIIACLSDHNQTTEAGIAVVEELVVKAYAHLSTAG